MESPFCDFREDQTPGLQTQRLKNLGNLYLILQMKPDSQRIMFATLRRHHETIGVLEIGQRDVPAAIARFRLKGMRTASSK
jgi:hypothetical protein